MRKIFVILASISLVACKVQATKQDINGSWVIDGQDCASEAYIFANDGSYITDMEEGTWSVSGKNLIMTSDSTVVMTITSLDENTMTTVDEQSREVFNWNRCELVIGDVH